MSDSWSNWDADEWVALATSTYPEIESVHLVGSRADPANARLESDWDVLVCLTAACYDDCNEPLENVEKRITFDPKLYFEGLDLLFLRPGGRQTRWDRESDGKVSSVDIPIFQAWWQEGEYARCLHGEDLTARAEVRRYEHITEEGERLSTSITRVHPVRRPGS
jgi:hypothetical protein